MLHMLKSRGCKGRKSNAVMAAASLVGAAIGGAALIVGKKVNEAKDGEPKEFPWVALMAAAGALLVVAVLGFLQWRRRAENGKGDGEDGPCSR
jgi:hypothetical protein